MARGADGRRRAPRGAQSAAPERRAPAETGAAAALLAPAAAADPQPILSRAAQAAGMQALRDGLERRLDRQAMTAHVLGTVRAAERAHAQDEAW